MLLSQFGFGWWTFLICPVILLVVKLQPYLYISKGKTQVRIKPFLSPLSPDELDEPADIEKLFLFERRSEIEALWKAIEEHKILASKAK